MILYPLAFDRIVAPRSATMDCKPPCFESIVFQDSKSSNGQDCKVFKTDRLFVIVYPKTESAPGLLLYGFYRKDFSNFSAVSRHPLKCSDPARQKALNADFACGEQLFKAMCAALFVDDSGANIEVLDKVLEADTPAAAKKATYGIKGFNTVEWDAVSRDVMFAAQMYKLRDVQHFERMAAIYRIAKEYGVEASRCYFFEATEDEPAVPEVPATERAPAVPAKPARPADKIWGTGKGIGAMFEDIMAEGNTERLRAFLDVNDEGAMDYRLYPGSNYLGAALQKALACVMQGPAEETHADFILRVHDANGFDFFECRADPPAKRHCSDSSNERLSDMAVEALAPEESKGPADTPTEVMEEEENAQAEPEKPDADSVEPGGVSLECTEDFPILSRCLSE